MTGDYEIKNNQRGIVSMTLSNFANMYTLAHLVTYLDSIKTDVRTGGIYQLKDLFKAGNNYQKRINKLIELQIKESDIPLLELFKGIQPKQKYYIADKALVRIIRSASLNILVDHFLFGFIIAVARVERKHPWDLDPVK